MTKFNLMISKKGSLNFDFRDFANITIKLLYFQCSTIHIGTLMEAGSTYADEKLTKPIAGDFKDWFHEDYKRRNANG